jgi:hypothetical protein
MRYRNGFLVVLATAATFALAAPAAQALQVNVWEAGTCVEKSCTYPSVEKNPGEAFTQAAGHPPWGITSFELNAPGGKPEEQVKRIRVDVPEGLAANPQALPSCSRAEFESNPLLCAAKGAKVGEAEAKSALENPITKSSVETTNTGVVYNLTPEKGLPLLFGIAIEPTGGVLVSPIHLLLEGHVSWGFEPSLAARGIPSGDFHEWFQIDNVPREAEAEILGIHVANAKLSTIKSKLYFEGTKGGHFLTLPSACSATTTSYLELETYEGGHASLPTHTPVGVTGCGAVPFKPTVAVKGEPSQYDSPDGAVTVLKVPQQGNGGEINTADIKDAHVTLPEGLTLNPSAAHGLEACTQSQLGKGGTAPVACPKNSKIGTVLIETALPPGSLAGTVYLGKRNGTAAITDPPFMVFIDAESTYGVSVRLEGEAKPNPSTGRVEVSFAGNPQLPFSELILTLNGGPQAPLANADTCAPAMTESLFTPWTGGAAAISSSPFTTTGCPASIPFSLSQNSNSAPATAGASPSSYTFNLARADGQQYLSKLTTQLPPGLVGMIPAVTECPEPGASAGNCPASSQIGTATVSAGSGSEPYAFTGPVYFTGPYAGAPFGLSVPIEAAAGPFDLGRITTRTAISIDPYTARVIATTTLPTIWKGIPLRLRTISVTVNKPSFLLNPTDCAALTQDSALTSTALGSATLSSPFQVGGCSALHFNPSVQVSTSRLTSSRANGIGLNVSVALPAHDSNVKSVVSTLPLQLPSRLTTLQKACLPATFAANPRGCSAESLVGTATVNTPVLPVPLTGPAYLVAKGGANFPDLDLVLEGDGVRVILVSNTAIHNGITTSTFASLPDVPFSSFSLSLPPGPHSALAAYGNLCAKPLLLPMDMTAHSGAHLHLSPRIAVTGCGVRILGKRRRGRFIYVKLQTFAPGRVVVSGKGLGRASKRVRKARIFTVKVPISKRTLRTLSALRHHHHRHVRLTINVLFLPSTHGEPSVRASTAIVFRH